MSKEIVKSEIENTKSKRKYKFAILKFSVLKKYHFEELLDYVKNVHEALEKKEKKIKKYKDKLKQLAKNFSKINVRNVPEPTKEKPSQNCLNNVQPSQSDLQNPEKQPLSFLDEIREAAESAQNENGFIYEPTSGLYYDQNTGYYYNAEYGLYYDGNSGCYYKLNPDTNQFEFHSQAAVEGKTNEKVDGSLSNIINKLSQLNIDNMRQNALAAEQNDSDSKSNHKTCQTNWDDFSDTDSNYYDSNKRNRNRTKNMKRSKASRRHDRKIIKYDDDLFYDKYRKNRFRDREDGEIISDSCDEGKRTDNSNSHNCENDKYYEDIATKYPPSLRIIVQETNLDKIQVGTLYIITFKGGTLGREGDHDVIIPDINVSKFHLKFMYNEEKKIYQCIDLGSRNGTILDGKRMATAKTESNSKDVVHGSIIELSQTKLMCHIHPGNATCSLCEPGLLIEHKDVQQKVTTLSRKEQLKQLQKRYGLENEKYVDTKPDGKYNDRAAVRRVKVGSSSQHEKTQVASTEIEISKDNKGFKMLSKLGWNKGERLGKGNEGLLEPIAVVTNPGTKGLGCADIFTALPLTKQDLKKTEQWKKAQERYKKIPSDIFNDSDDDIPKSK